MFDKLVKAIKYKVSEYNSFDKQESPAVARKPRDAATVLFGSKFAERRTRFETQRVMALQGHLRSLILSPIESALCDFLLVIDSNLGPILPRFRDIAGFLLRSSTPPQFHRNFGVFPLD